MVVGSMGRHVFVVSCMNVSVFSQSVLFQGTAKIPLIWKELQRRISGPLINIIISYDDGSVGESVTWMDLETFCYDLFSSQDQSKYFAHFIKWIMIIRSDPWYSPFFEIAGPHLSQERSESPAVWPGVQCLFTVLYIVVR